MRRGQKLLIQIVLAKLPKGVIARQRGINIEVNHLWWLGASKVERVNVLNHETTHFVYREEDLR